MTTTPPAPTMPTAAASAAAEYDLTRRLAPYLDRHLVIPLLDFLQDRGLYPAAELQQSKLGLLAKTNMVDYYAEVLKEVSGDTGDSQQLPADVREKRQQVVERLRGLQGDIKVFLDTFSEEEGARLINQLSSEKNFNLEYLERTYGISERTLDSMYHYAKFQFECGNYSAAAEYLYFYRTLSVTRTHDLSAMWGKLAAEILMQNWETALEDRCILREHIDSQSQPQLQSCAWLLHWALFIFFNHADGWDSLLDLFFQDRYLHALQTLCPWLLRYVATACVAGRNNNKRRPQGMKDLVRVVEQEVNAYSDPVTEFVRELFVAHNFEAAQERLRQCETVLLNDFFLVSCHAEFMESAKMMIFEMYCRIHSVIDIAMIAEKLGMDCAKAEVWIVNLIRQARLDARIDSQANQVIMEPQSSCIYQQVKEKTKNLGVRTMMLTEALTSKFTAMKMK